MLQIPYLLGSLLVLWSPTRGVAGSTTIGKSGRSTTLPRKSMIPRKGIPSSSSWNWSSTATVPGEGRKGRPARASSPRPSALGATPSRR